MSNISGTIRLTTAQAMSAGVNPAIYVGPVGPAPVLTIGTVDYGDDPFATITGTPEHPVLNLVLPRGLQGPIGETGGIGPTGERGSTGNGIASFARSSGNGAPGTTDIYTLTMTDGQTAALSIYNGRDGLGSGDMLLSVYDTNDDGRVDGADEADKLTTPRKISISGGATGTATDFDGSADITIPVTALDVSKATAGTLGIERGGTGATTADGARSNIGAASTSVYTAAIPNTGWLGSAAPYSIDVTVTGILTSDAPIVDIVQTGTWATDEAMRDDWGKITRITTAADKIAVTASEIPAADIAIQMKVVR